MRKALRRETLRHDGIFTLPLPPDQGTGLGKPLKMLTKPERPAVPIYVAALGEKNVQGTAEYADGWLPFLFAPEKAHDVWGEALAAGRARRSADLGPLEISAGGMVAVGDDVKGLLDLARPMAALYIGGMGAKGRTSTTPWSAATASRRRPRRSRSSTSAATSATRGARPARAARDVQPRRAGVLREGADRGVRRGGRDQPPGDPGRRRPGGPGRPAEGMGVLTMRAIFEDEHESFRSTVRSFLEKEVVPHHEQWEKDGMVPRELWTKAGALGLLCFDVDEEYGGAGVKDFRYNMVMAEELSRCGASGPGFPVHTDIIVPYVSSLGTDEQKRRWLPGLVSGETISAIAMTEPGAGSDLQGIRTTAVDKGDHYVLNGSKTFISNGILADLVIVVARTDAGAGHKGISLLVVERGMDGFERGRNLDKMGLKAQDTAELFFDDVVVPKENLLGEEGSGFVSLMQNLPQERLSIAMIAAAACEHILDLSLAYAKEREAFGRPIGKFQHNRFLIAEMATEAHIARVFVDDCVQRHNRGELDAKRRRWRSGGPPSCRTRLVDRAVQRTAATAT